MSTTTRTFTFGPGSLESIEVKAFAGRRTGVTGQKHAEVSGTYRVYAQSGEYTVEIKERFTAFTSERTQGYEQRWTVEAAEGDADAAAELAGLAIDYALEGWSDPYPEDAGWDAYYAEAEADTVTQS